MVDAKLAVDATAGQTTRRFVEADVPTAHRFGAAKAEARRAGYATLDAHGRDPGLAYVALTGLETPAGAAGFVRGARVTFTARYDAPVLSLPWIGGLGSGLAVTGTLSELVTPYRDVPLGAPRHAGRRVLPRTAQRGLLSQPEC